MLCRVADSLFWLGRYIERAENTVRLVEVTHHSLLESESSAEDISYSQWQPILASLGDQALFEKLYDDHSSYNVSYFLTFDTENPSSVFSCIASARENARMIRDQISTEMWETINGAFLYLKNTDADKVCTELDFNFYQEIKRYTLLFQGIKEVTFNHKLGYEFLTCGYELERADKTCRILDTKRHMDLGKETCDDTTDVAQWSAILRACSGFEAYHHEFAVRANENNIAKFLILSRDFPRSVQFCLRKLQAAIHAISGCPITHFSNEAERQVGMLVSNLQYITPESLKDEEMHDLIESIEERLATIAIALRDKYMFSEITDPATEAEDEATGELTGSQQSQTQSEE